MFGRIILIGIFIVMSHSAAAEEPMSKKQVTESLSSFFDNLKTLTADFEQLVENAQLSSVAKASGKLWIERPGKFRWDYLAPYEQEIVSDGVRLWIFDKDLEQVTVRDINGSMGNTPAVLLSDSSPISDTFNIHVIGKKENLDWVKLLPKDTEASFTAIQLGFNGPSLSEMLLEDNLGQTTRLQFSNINKNSRIDSNKFSFTPPDGVDIFETSE